MSKTTEIKTHDCEKVPFIGPRFAFKDAIVYEGTKMELEDSTVFFQFLMTGGELAKSKLQLTNIHMSSGFKTSLQTKLKAGSCFIPLQKEDVIAIKEKNEGTGKTKTIKYNGLELRERKLTDKVARGLIN